MTTKIGAYAGTACVGLMLGLALYRVDHDRSDGYQAAVELEQNHRSVHTTSSYSDDPYHGILKELARVPVWSPDYSRARAWSLDIARARRVAAMHEYPQLGYPRRWAHRPTRPEDTGPASDHKQP